MSMLPSHLESYSPLARVENTLVQPWVTAPFDYRPAMTVSEWQNLVYSGNKAVARFNPLEGHGELVIEYQLDMIPWYQKGYYWAVAPQAPPTHHQHTLWGNVFVLPQASLAALGCASFHFLSPTEAYISFENHRMCVKNLVGRRSRNMFHMVYRHLGHDMGLVARKLYFSNIAWSGRKFRGEIAYGPEDSRDDKDYRICYDIKFDSKYSTIIAASATAVPPHAGTGPEIYCGSTRVNAALWNSVGDAAVREGRTRKEAVTALLVRLQADSCSADTAEKVRRIASAPTNPVDCSYTFL